MTNNQTSPAPFGVLFSDELAAPFSEPSAFNSVSAVSIGNQAVATNPDPDYDDFDAGLDMGAAQARVDVLEDVLRRLKKLRKRLKRELAEAEEELAPWTDDAGCGNQVASTNPN